MRHYRATPSRAPLSAAAIAAPAGSLLAGQGARAGAVLFAAVLTGTAAQLSVTVPWTAVPFTMQPLAVLMAGAVLGARLGAMSQALYLALGIAGASMFALSPVLAPGLGRLLGPTGGFLMAYPLAAFVAGWMAERGWTARYAGAVVTLTAGMSVIYAGGAAWLALVSGPAAVTALGAFALTDVVKVVVAATVLPAAVRRLGSRL